MAGKVRHGSEGGGGAATEEAGGLGTFAGASTATGATSSHSQTQKQAQCWPCHLPYHESVVPFRVVASRCSVCRRHRVPEMMYTSIEPPEGIAISGRGCLLQAYVCRNKRDMGRGELNAKEISDGLPFLEYELHRTLCYKLRLRGMNAVFGLRVQVAIGERLMVAMATGTACYLAALPPAPVPLVAAGNLLTEDSALVEVQRMVQDSVRRSREAFGLPVVPRTAGTAATGPATAASSTTCTAAAAASSTTTTTTTTAAAAAAASDTDESEEDLPELELASGNKDACVFEIDDDEDMELVKHLLEPPPPEGFQACTTELPPGLDESELAPGPQMFTHVWRSRLPVPQAAAGRTLHALCKRLLQGLFFKLRRAAPAALTRLRFRVELPDADEIQISVLGMALGVVEVERPPPRGRRKLIVQSCSRELLSTRRDESDLIFSLEEDQVAEAAPSGGTPPPSAPAASPAAPTSAPMPAVRPLARTFQSLRISSHGGAGAASAAAAALSRERFGVDISPLSYAPGGRIERYIGNLNFFFIRESTSIREAGGLSGFVHSFACEVLAIVRSHVTALGGNAMVAYFMSECVLYHNPHKNQGQCLINVGGDVVSVAYDE